MIPESDPVRVLRIAACAALFVLAAFSSPLLAQAPSSPAARPVPEIVVLRTATAPVLDGRLTEEVWRRAKAAAGFVQRDPDEGRPATEATEVRVAYDESALYVGLRFLDSQPSGVTRRLSRRDAEPDSDFAIVYLDSRHDHFTGFAFAVSAAGAQYDAVVYNDTSEDSSWDAVWDAAVASDESGWSAEMRIPFSQLRYGSEPRQTWGINVCRFLRRHNERSWLEMVPKKENGLASRFAHLSGFESLPHARHLEVLPYAVTRGEFVQAAAGDAFNDGSRAFGRAGLDLKWGVASNLTLDLTVNPDFGQVEVDPAVVNLTAFETFYEEKRPFFIEGADILQRFGRGGANSFFGFNNSEPTLFYSRRIGRAPQGSARAGSVDRPRDTTILGAAKLSGKVSNGWSLGVLEAVTGTEHARLADAARQWREQVEPATNYLVARAKRDVARGGYGVLLTGVQRRLSADTLRALLPGQAYVAGGDGYYFLDAKRTWVVTGGISGSWVEGSAESISRLQRAPQHYFQRPDAPQVNLDETATSLAGWSGRINLNRNAGDLRVNAGLWGVSPGFESNDLGYLTRADAAGAHAVVIWSKPRPDRFTRHRGMWVGKYWNWNFDRRLHGDGVYSNASATLLNYWDVFASVGLNRSVQDDRLTRGGPIMRRPATGSAGVGISTDSRKPASLQLNANHSWNEYGGFGSYGEVTCAFKPSSSLTLSTGPGLSRTHALGQYVRRVEDATAAHTLGARYVFSDIDQTEVSMVTRADMVLTPRVSLQLYAQPLLSMGRYWGLKELTRPGVFEFLRYGTGGSTILPVAGRRAHTVDPDGPGPAAPFEVADPSFNFKSLRLNAIFRWEYRPGSTLYVVWSEDRQDLSRPGEFALGSDTRSLLRANPDDVFVVKLSYWFGR